MVKVKSKSRLRRFNNYLTTVVIALSVYIIVNPFLPNLTLWWNQLTDSSDGYHYRGKLAESNGKSDDGLAQAPTENTIIIPQIQVDEAIINSDAPEAVDLGVWRRPHTSTPDKGSNTVIVAHRFAYTHGATFYHLDKIKVGDKFAIFWEGYEYVYEVFDVGVVGPKALEIEEPTDSPIVTLYTCTPIWTAENRLVVKANLVDQAPIEGSSSNLGNLDFEGEET